jgi:hypothetical protein
MTAVKRSSKLVSIVLMPIASFVGVSRTATKPDEHHLRDAEKGLQLAATVASERVSASDPLKVTVVLKNVSEGPIAVLSHIATHETHLDWYRFRLAYLAPDHGGAKVIRSAA